MSFPYLSIIIFSPVVGALIIMALPKEKHLAIKLVAAVCAFISLAFSIYGLMTRSGIVIPSRFVPELPPHAMLRLWREAA